MFACLCRYDLPSEYSTLMLQYRHSVFNCVPRFFEERNTTILSRESGPAHAAPRRAALHPCLS